MRKYFKSLLCVSLLVGALFVRADFVEAASRKQMAADARAALNVLYTNTAAAKALGAKAKAVLVFPEIIKGGFIAGGQYGDGTLFKGDKVVGFYNSAAASFGLQAGIQKFGYALFFMNDSDLRYLDNSNGWEVGVGPSITIVDQGLAKAFTTTTASEGVYAFFFEQKGLMAGMGIQGAKITRLSDNG